MTSVFGVAMGATRRPPKARPSKLLQVECLLCKKRFPAAPARAKVARYCSVACRVADYQSHKHVSCKAKPKAFW
jgi:hypothetical protein